MKSVNTGVGHSGNSTTSAVQLSDSGPIKHGELTWGHIIAFRTNASGDRTAAFISFGNRPGLGELSRERALWPTRFAQLMVNDRVHVRCHYVQRGQMLNLVCDELWQQELQRALVYFEQNPRQQALCIRKIAYVVHFRVFDDNRPRRFHNVEVSWQTIPQSLQATIESKFGSDREGAVYFDAKITNGYVDEDKGRLVLTLDFCEPLAEQLRVLYPPNSIRTCWIAGNGKTVKIGEEEYIVVSVNQTRAYGLLNVKRLNGHRKEDVLRQATIRLRVVEVTDRAVIMFAV